MAIVNDVVSAAARPAALSPFVIDDFVISLFKECTPRFLVVTDGGLSFGNADFGLSDFVDTLKASTIHGMTPIVKTAHRGATAADYSNFTFTNSTLSISKYDVLFLFGYSSGGSLPNSEVNVIESFMDAGGGVFATGDHATLGKQLCGDIKRVKDMRRWNGPSASSSSRISTNDPGTNNAFTFNDQSDSIPQKIYPAYKGTPGSSEPHFLLQHPAKKIIEVLPDHPHESECWIPNDLSNVNEWPKGNRNATISPELVALSMSYGGGFSGKQPISVPRSFGAIGAYNGHLCNGNIGRICVDATWHHFININLIASGAGPGLEANADAYDRVHTYFRNIADWLMPKKVRKCLRWPFLIAVQKYYPIAEFIEERRGKALELEAALELGNETRSTLARFMANAAVSSFADDLLDLTNPNLAEQLNQLQNSSKLQDALNCAITPKRAFDNVALGFAIHTINELFPTDQDLQARFKEVGGIEGIEKRVKQELTAGFRLLGNELAKVQENIHLLKEFC